MRDKRRQTLKIELLSQWKLEAEFRNCISWLKYMHIYSLLNCLVVLSTNENNYFQWLKINQLVKKTGQASSFFLLLTNMMKTTLDDQKRRVDLISC